MKTEELISKEVRVSNADNDNRQFTIKAIATINSSGVSSIREGDVCNESGVIVGTFNAYNPGSLNTSFSTENRAEVLAAIDEFVADLNANAATL